MPTDTTTLRSELLHPARTGRRPITAEDLWRLPRVGAPSPNPDGNACAVPVTTWNLDTNQSRTRIWWVTADGTARGLTTEDATSQEPRVSPDGKRLAFTRKPEGGKPQLHVMPLDGGEAQSLTQMPLGVFDPRWTPDGKGIVFGAVLLKGHLTPAATKTELERREKDPVKAHVTEDRLFRYWDTWLTTGETPHLFHLDLASGSVRDLTPEATWWFDWMEPSDQYDIAPDGRELALSAIEFDAEHSLIRSYVWLVPIDGGAPRCITRNHPANDHGARYTKDGRSIVYGMQHDATFYADRVRLMRYDRARDTHEEIAADWPLSAAHWIVAPDGALLIEAEEAGRTSLFRWTGSGTPQRIVRGGVVGNVAAAGGRLWFTLHSMMQPPEVAIADLDGNNVKRVTTFTDAITSEWTLGEVRELFFEGAYGETVQMYLVLPPGAREGQPLPLVHVVHGGPHATSADTFHFRWNVQMFASPGYAVAAVNFQGSTSWGQDFAQRILGGWGDRPFQDVMKATDALIAAGIADPDRMALTGGSYGGYIASWVAGNTDRFKCIVNHAGVFDTLSQYASDVTQGRARAFGGEPWEGLEAIDRFNPARFAKGFNTPMLVLHGERDYRVPVTQGLECYGMLKAKGVPARLVYFPDENHWILKARNSLLWYREVMGWLERWIGKA